MPALSAEDHRLASVDQHPLFGDPSHRLGQHLRLDIAPWGVVYVDGQMQGLTPPLKQLWLQPGQHTIEVRNTGLPSHTETITIEAGKDVQLRHQFE